jgi:hypothetical protein
MIAANFRKYPEAMALQLVLQFGHALVWATARPGARVLRAIRAARAAAFKAAGRIAYPKVKSTPQWFKDARRQAQRLAAAIKAACLDLANDTHPPYDPTDLELELALHFEHLASLDIAAEPTKCTFQPGKGSPFDGAPCPVCNQTHHWQA